MFGELIVSDSQCEYSDLRRSNKFCFEVINWNLYPRMYRRRYIIFQALFVNLEVMNSSTLSPTTLGPSSGQSESQDSGLASGSSQTSKILSHMKSELQVQKQQKRLFKELHAKRVQSLRKELEYLKATEWR